MPANKISSGTRAFDQRQRVWRHNAFSGHAKMMESQLRAIVEADSTNGSAKALARKMLECIPALKLCLKTRIDP